MATSALVLSEALFLPLMLLAQWGLAVLWGPAGGRRLSRGAAVGWGLLTGAASGAAVLVRPSWALFVPAVLVAWVVAERAAAGGRRPAGAVLVVARPGRR